MGIGFTGELTFNEMIQQVEVCEKAGFDSAWVAEDYFLRDAVSVVAAFAAVTKNIKIGIGVINPYTRNPALTAMTVAALDEISKGRLIFGIGTGVKSIQERIGIGVGKRLLAIRETIEVLRKFLRRENVEYHGQIVNIDSVRLGFHPLREEVPIYMAAVGPKMLQLAGELADGVLLTAGCSPKYVTTAKKNIRIGAEKTGRDPSSIDVACYIICSVSDSSDKAFEAARSLVGLTISPPEYGKLVLEETGLDPSLLDRIGQVPTDDEGIRRLSKVVTDEMVDALSASGTPERFRKKLDEYMSSGVDLPIITPVRSCFNKVISSL